MTGQLGAAPAPGAGRLRSRGALIQSSRSIQPCSTAPTPCRSSASNVLAVSTASFSNAGRSDVVADCAGQDPFRRLTPTPWRRQPAHIAKTFERFEQPLGVSRIGARTTRKRVCTDGCPAATPRLEQLAKQRQCRHESIAGAQFVREARRAQPRQCGRDGRAKEQRIPGQVHPQQEERQGREGAINGTHCTAPDEVRKGRLQQFSEDGRDKAADQGIVPTHRAIRHEHIQRRVGEPVEDNRCVVDHAAQPSRHASDRVLRQRPEVRTRRQAGTDQDRPQRDDGPVDQHALADRPALVHLPDVVQHAVDRHDHRQRRDAEEDQPGRGQARCLLRKFAEIAQHRGGDLCRQRPLHQRLECLAKLREEGKHRKKGERHCKERHDRQDRRERQAAGNLLQARLAAAPVREQRHFACGLQPGKGVEGSSEAGHGGGLTATAREYGPAATVSIIRSRSPRSLPAVPS